MVLLAASISKLSPVANRIDLELKAQSDNVAPNQVQGWGVSLTDGSYSLWNDVQLGPSCTYFSHYKAKNVDSAPNWKFGMDVGVKPYLMNRNMKVFELLS